MEREKRRRGFFTQMLMTALPFAIGGAVFWWLFGVMRDEPNPFLSIILFGIVSGLIFGWTLTAYERWRWGSVRATSHPSFAGDGETKIETPAVHDSVTGYLALTDREILFRVNSTNYRDLHIALDRVKRISEWRPSGSSGDGIEVELVDGRTERFEMEDASPWEGLRQRFGRTGDTAPAV